MALRATFEEVVEMTRLEARLSSNSSRGVDHLANIKQLVRRHYYSLAETYDWQHLELKKETAISRVVLEAGSRTYDFPTALNPLKISRALVYWGSSWTPLTFGIRHELYSVHDHVAGARSDPVSNWTYYHDDGFEVWPTPQTDGVADGANEVAFEGQRKVEQLTIDGDRLDMDDMLISLMAATEILAGNGQDKAAAVKGEAAVSRLSILRANLSSKQRFTMNLGMVDGRGAGWPRHPTYIR